MAPCASLPEETVGFTAQTIQPCKRQHMPDAGNAKLAACAGK